MLGYLRQKRAPISRWLLTLLAVFWLGLVAQTCAMAEAQADASAECCCEEPDPDCDWGYTSIPESGCPAMRSAGIEHRNQGLRVAESALADLAPPFARIDYPPSAPGRAPARLADLALHRAHPALRFRVLLI